MNKSIFYWIILGLLFNLLFSSAAPVLENLDRGKGSEHVGLTRDEQAYSQQKNLFCSWVCVDHPDMGGNYCRCDKVRHLFC